MRRRMAALLALLLLGCGAGAAEPPEGTLLRGAALEHVVQRWRAAEYGLQAGDRRVRALQGHLSAKAEKDATSQNAMTWDHPASEAQLAAQLAAARAQLDALRPELEQLRAAVNAVWPPPPGEAGANVSETVLSDDELPPERGCSAARLRSGARPHPTAPIPPGAFTRRYNISFMLQYYKHPANINAIVDTLYACTTGSAYGGPVAPGVPNGTTSELIVNVDSRGDAVAWDAAVNRTAAGSFLTVLLSNNLHEVHGYNRAAGVARGEVLVLLQDDMIPPTDCRWVSDLLARFHAFPRLGAVGLNIAEFWYPGDSHSIGNFSGERAVGHRMPQHALMYRHAGVPFQFVTVADFSPFAVRASALAAVGGLDEGMAAPGDCGIFSDYELSLRMWASGWQVGHMALRGGMRGGEGVGGTHASEKAGLQCWHRQAQLGSAVVGVRYSAADSADAYRQVRALNARLEAAFDGPPLWEQCCMQDTDCRPCGAVHNGFLDP
jgi:hypothetical protein